MKLLLLLIFTILVPYQFTDGFARKCLPTEYFSWNAPTCEPTCIDRNPVCYSDELKSGCICRPGYVHKSEEFKLCIPLRQCQEGRKGHHHHTNPTQKHECGPNEIYKTIDLMCPRTCEFLTQECNIKQIGKRCGCADGYVMRSLENPICVPVSSCRDTCSRPNFEWSNCHSHCEPTCQQRIQKPFCIRMCNIGCKCKTGYVLDEETYQCVRQWDGCPNKDYW